MRKQFSSRSGQLSLPILAVLILFSFAIGLHARRSLRTYRQMRLDVTADLVALSTGRSAAQMLNTIASTQLLINVALQKAAVLGEDYGHMQISARGAFEALQATLELQLVKFFPELLHVAKLTAKANGSQAIPVPLTPKHMQPLLEGKDVHVAFFYGYVPVGGTTYRNAYYVRQWKPETLYAQPVHSHVWALSEHSLVTKGKAVLWLDLPPNAFFHNGGFPPSSTNWWSGIGIQCKLPHFNARLMPRDPRA